MGYKIAIAVSDFLIKTGYLEMAIGYRTPGAKKGHLTKIRATEKLIKLMDEAKAELSMFKIAPDLPVIKLKDEKKKLIEFEDNPMTLGREKDMKEINSRLSEMDISYDLTPEQETQLLKQGGSNLLDTVKVPLARAFVRGSWECGGRLCGGFWQNWPEDLRRHLIINGKKVVELDYTSLHPTILYHWKLKRNPPDNCYALDGYSNDKVCRKFLKMLLLTMLNATNFDSAIRGIRSEVNKGKLELPSDVPDSTTKALTKVMTDMALKHLPIQGDLCNDIGVKLQMFESNINMKILEKFKEVELPLPLPEYDSFIVSYDKEEFLRKAMQTSYGEIVRGGWTIGIDKKY